MFDARQPSAENLTTISCVELFNLYEHYVIYFFTTNKNILRTSKYLSFLYRASLSSTGLLVELVSMLGQYAIGNTSAEIFLASLSSYTTIRP
jgi:hypothetical protein